MYGGTIPGKTFLVESRGLSPRVRGNHPRKHCESSATGSIPACTGEPWIPSGPGRPSEVYPRVYGGTLRRRPRVYPIQGLSPRVRGNLLAEILRATIARSIPACTGEPNFRCSTGSASKVYPRVYGGTNLRAAQAAGEHGLSPRVRGNHHRDHRRRRNHGSIPACTGEPWPVCMTDWIWWVYPRVYGGTGGGLVVFDHAEGLSPRVRGNRALSR